MTSQAVLYVVNKGLDVANDYQRLKQEYANLESQASGLVSKYRQLYDENAKFRAQFNCGQKDRLNNPALAGGQSYDQSQLVNALLVSVLTIIEKYVVLDRNLRALGGFINKVNFQIEVLEEENKIFSDAIKNGVTNDKNGIVCVKKVSQVETNLKQSPPVRIPEPRFSPDEIDELKGAVKKAAASSAVSPKPSPAPAVSPKPSPAPAVSPKPSPASGTFTGKTIEEEVEEVRKRQEAEEAAEEAERKRKVEEIRKRKAEEAAAAAAKPSSPATAKKVEECQFKVGDEVIVQKNGNVIKKDVKGTIGDVAFDPANKCQYLVQVGTIEEGFEEIDLVLAPAAKPPSPAAKPPTPSSSASGTSASKIKSPKDKFDEITAYVNKASERKEEKLAKDAGILVDGLFSDLVKDNNLVIDDDTKGELTSPYVIVSLYNKLPNQQLKNDFVLLMADKLDDILKKINPTLAGGSIDPYYMKYMKYKTKYLVKSDKTKEIVRKLFIN